MKKILTISVLSSAIALGGCASVNPYTGQQEVSRTTLGAGAGAAGGAILGALVGGGRGALIGAAAGGVLGGVTGNYMDRQNNELRQRLEGTGVQVVKNGNDIQLSMASDITFKLNSSDISSRFYETLHSVAIVLNKYTNTNIMVYGYTDSTGTAEYNQVLSENRARSVGGYLISQGVNQNRVFTKGLGERSPIASNNTDQGRKLNRRVVIILRQMGS